MKQIMNVMFLLGRMRSKLPLLICAGGVFWGCQSTPKTNKGLSIDLHPLKQQMDIETAIPASEWIDSVCYIPLETTSECLIKEPSRIWFLNDTIAVCDRELGAVHLFDHNGRYLSSINRRGRGPQEYIGIRDAFIDPKTGQIVIFCGETNRLLYYQTNGVFVRSIDAIAQGALIRNVAPLSNGNFLCYTYDYSVAQVGEQFSGLWEVDQQGRFIRNYFTYLDTYPIIFAFETSYFQPNHVCDTLFLRDALYSHLYAVTASGIDTLISYRQTSSALEALKGKDNAQAKPDYTLSIRTTVKGKWVVSYWLDQEKGLFVSLADRNTNQVRFANSWDMGDQIIPNSWFRDSNMDHAIVWVASQKWVMEYAEKVDKNTPLGRLIAPDRYDPTTQNPILQIAYLKK